jgi:hypothetical protein
MPQQALGDPDVEDADNGDGDGDGDGDGAGDGNGDEERRVCGVGGGNDAEEAWDELLLDDDE